LLASGCGFDRVIHFGTRLLCHAEAAIGKPLFHILARPAERGELEVVDSRGAVHGDMADDALSDPSIYQRTQAYFYYMAAE
jgi:hypothetical protein